MPPRMEREQRLDNLRFEVADVYTLPFAAASFDVVYAHQLLQHLADPVAALREAARVLRPGGYVAVRDADYGTMTHHPNDPTIDRWLEVYRTVARANGGEPDAGRHLLEWVLAAGFEHIHAGASSWVFASPDDRRWWADLWADRSDPEPDDAGELTPYALARRGTRRGYPQRPRRVRCRLPSLGRAAGRMVRLHPRRSAGAEALVVSP